MDIVRIGKIDGRFPHYTLIVGGVELGKVKRKVTKGRDGNTGRRQPAYDVWAIHGTECVSQQDAERTLIERAIRFGTLKG